ncbi:Coenzyme F420-dependent N5,N10-methylene tetrahydromethanopterin reductase [Cystobacter fuscus DSM 2262]|uniref:Coenzyme F420-dependent N5,N10-methylene tetrahydromethanopterin reductase n=1 Tax=Cystobacter fuscus (strain ATCC 25194 / DSM 2262 / NBRC 100088 / M29) TaxID=1242864 RepID=S9NW67_CYSF2|nr:LLM class flavin-dependent oxidoreductase [Cystobacter fuscus]EPX56465.1 Coenzyme F420-dependent N5,N10-methylene tetrahydromethanopterin reductase [Cystobacter fuscus DSM 2262]
MKYGFWAPVFGGWLRNVRDEGMEASWEYMSRLCRRAEEIGYDLTLIAELNLNDIKGVTEPALDAWSTAAALAAVTRRLELMVAVRPNFHHPALFAKQAANIDRISGGRLALNVVSSWWADEAKQYGLQFDQHDDRYARTTEWLQVVDGLWSRTPFSFEGQRYQLKDAICEPKPLSSPRPLLYAGGESEAAKQMIARQCDAYVMHGDEPEVIAGKIQDMRARREREGLPPMRFGMAAYAIVRDSQAEAEAEVERITTLDPQAAGFANFEQWLSGTQLERELKIKEYSVSNRGLRPGLVGTPQRVRARIAEFEKAGVDLLLLQMSPQLEEMERFSSVIIAPERKAA